MEFFLAHSNGLEASLEKRLVDIKNIVVLMLNEESNKNVGIIGGAEGVTRCCEKFNRFAIRKLEGNSENYCGLFGGVVTILRDLAEKSAIHIHAGIDLRVGKIETSGVIPEKIVEALVLVNKSVIEAARSGRCYFLRIGEERSVNELGDGLDCFFVDFLVKIFCCTHTFFTF